MNNLRRWISYDTFKLIMALVLLVIFVILLLQGPGAVIPAAAAINTPTAAAAAQQPSATTVQATNTSPAAPSATASLEPSPSPTQVQPTATQAAQPTPTPTIVAPTATPAAAEPTATPAGPTATPAAAAQNGSTSADCPLAAPSHLAVGKQAQVTANLNLRQTAGMDKPIQSVSLPGQKLDITGGPQCIPYGNGAYLWWNVKTASGAAGWSAEASLSKNFYFMAPLP